MKNWFADAVAGVVNGLTVFGLFWALRGLFDWFDPPSSAMSFIAVLAWMVALGHYDGRRDMR